MLGYTIVGNDVNRDGLSDIAIGAPMAGAPSKAGGGAVYVVFGSRNPADVDERALVRGVHERADAPRAPLAARQPLRRLPAERAHGHVAGRTAGRQRRRLPRPRGGRAGRRLHSPGGGGVAVLYGKPLGVHITLNDLWENGYPYSFHIDYPAIANQHVGMSVASVGDMTGDGWPDIAVGAPQADPAGRIDAGSVWIISGHLPPIVGCTKASPAGVCPWIKLRSLSAAQGYRIDGPVAGAQLGSSLAGIGDQNGDGLGDLAIGQAGASPLGRARAGAVVVVPGQRNAVTRDLAVTPPLQTIIGPAAGAALGSSLAAAGDVGGTAVDDVGAPGDSSSAGAVYLVPGAPGRPPISHWRRRSRRQRPDRWRAARSRPARRSTAPAPTR